MRHVHTFVIFACHDRWQHCRNTLHPVFRRDCAKRMTAKKKNRKATSHSALAASTAPGPFFYGRPASAQPRQHRRARVFFLQSSLAEQPCMNAPDILSPASPTASTPDRIDMNVFHALQARLPACETCGEKPALDRRVLNPGPADTRMLISSGSSIALDFALNSPARTHAMDATTRRQWFAHGGARLSAQSRQTLRTLRINSCRRQRRARPPHLHLLHASDILAIGGRPPNSCIAVATA